MKNYPRSDANKTNNEIETNDVGSHVAAQPLHDYYIDLMDIGWLQG